MLRHAAALAVLLVTAASTPATAQLVEVFEGDEPFRIDADEAEYDAVREVYIGRGNVKIAQGEKTLRAEWVAINRRTGRGVASGDVVYTAGADTIYTEFFEFDAQTLRGVLFDARFESTEDGFELEGAEIRKTGEDTYSFEKGVFTTCRCPADSTRDPWRIRAQKADLEVGGYGTARNTTFDILGVPVIWLPWMAYPLKTERETGLLFPEFATGNSNGFQIGLPFFWAAAENLNVTLTPSWLQERGFKGDAKVEYVLGERSEGEVEAAFINDESINANSVGDPFDRERWYVAGEQDVFLPGEVRFKSDFRFASDNQYPVDFDDLRDFRAFRYLEAVAFAGRGFGVDDRFGLTASSTYADDMQNPNDIDRDKVVLQRVPTVDVASLPQPLSFFPHVVPALDVEYAHFYPKDRAWQENPNATTVGNKLFLDTGIDGIANQREVGFGPADPDPNRDDFITERDGRFQEGEPLADRGHRLRLRPRVAVPFRLLDAVEVYPEAGLYQTLYTTSAQDYESRTLATGRVELRTRLRGDFSGVTHYLEPRLGWAFVSDVNQKNKPLFVPETAVPQTRIRQFTLDNITADPADRIDDYNGITFGFWNRFFRGETMLADFGVSAGYRFDEMRVQPIFLDGRAYPVRNTRMRFNFGFDPVDVSVREALASIYYEHDAGHSINFGYRYRRKVPRVFEDFQTDNKGRFENFDNELDRISQLRLSLRVALPWRFSAFYDTAYTFEDNLFLANRGGLEYLSACGCWAVGIEISQNRIRGLQYSLTYKITGLGQDSNWRSPSEFNAGQFDVLDAF